MIAHMAWTAGRSIEKIHNVESVFRMGGLQFSRAPANGKAGIVKDKGY